MIEPSFLIAVYRIIGRIHIQNDLERRLFMGLQKMIYKQPIDLRIIPTNLFVRVCAEGSSSGELQPI